MKRINDYVEQRFLQSNHPKYIKYCKEWMSNLIPNQIQYFLKEKERREFLGLSNF